MIKSTFENAKTVIENGTYASKEEMKRMLDIFFMRGRIILEEYDILVKLLEDKELEKNPPIDMTPLEPPIDTL